MFVNGFFGDIFRQFQVYGAGTLFLREAKCLPHHGGNHIYVDDLSGVFCEGFHHAHDVDDLKLALFALFDGFLARDHEQGHAAQLGIGGARHKVGRAGTECGKADAGFAREPSIGRSHKCSTLFVAGQDEFDARFAKGFQKGEVFFSGYAVDIFHAFIFQCFDK